MCTCVHSEFEQQKTNLNLLLLLAARSPFPAAQLMGLASVVAGGRKKLKIHTKAFSNDKNHIKIRAAIEILV